MTFDNRRPLLFWILTLLLAGVAMAEPAHYIVFEVDADGNADPVFIRTVDLPEVGKSQSVVVVEEARQRALDGHPVRALELKNAAGETVHRSTAKVPQWIRGEFHGSALAGGGSEIEGHRFPAEHPSFVARVPAIPGARLVVDGTTRSIIDLDRLVARKVTLRYEDSVGPGVITRGGGIPPNRVDLLIMGDGYTAAQQPNFDTDALNLENNFLAISPYAEYRNFLNVTTLFTPSNQSGADHPPYSAGCSGDNKTCCSDSAAQGDPLAGTYVNTALDARYCAFMIHRLLVVDTTKVLVAAASAPSWDQILVLVNDTTYGGSGGQFAVGSTNQFAVEVMQHEFGHSFTDLADEYESPYPSFPSCSDVTSPPCEANVTDETNLASVKWAPWIQGATPVPTPETAQYSSVSGLFQGARYLSGGMYRPWLSCAMRSLGVPFGSVCSQEYIRVLYEGGWGTPFDGVDPVEAVSPPTALPIDGTGGVTMAAALLQPVGGPPLSLNWFVNGVQQPAAAGQQFFTFVPPGAGTYIVEIEVRDVTPLVHPSMTGGFLTSTRAWTVTQTNGDPGSVRTSLRVNPSQNVSGDLVLSWSPSCSSGAVDYGIYEGILGNFYSHKLVDCTDDGTPFSEEVSPSGFSAYYMVVPLNGVEEGSHGKDSQGTERPRVGPVCTVTQSLTPCP